MSMILDAKKPTLMLRTATYDEEEIWKQIPEDGRWKTLMDVATRPIDALEGAKGYPQLAGGHKNFINVMGRNIDFFTAMLRCFGIDDTVCELCDALNQSCRWNMSSCSRNRLHFNKLYEVIDVESLHRRTVVREEVWQQVHVLGGILRFNHLDGETQGLRCELEEEFCSVSRPQDIPQDHGGKWVLVGHPGCCAIQPRSLLHDWPQLWSLTHWKEKMARPIERLLTVLRDCKHEWIYCKICGDKGSWQSLSYEHLRGKSHFNMLRTEATRLHNTGSAVKIDSFWQSVIVHDDCRNQQGMIALNHLDGSCRLHRPHRENEVKQNPEKEQPASVSREDEDEEAERQGAEIMEQVLREQYGLTGGLLPKQMHKTFSFQDPMESVPCDKASSQTAVGTEATSRATCSSSISNSGENETYDWIQFEDPNTGKLWWWSEARQKARWHDPSSSSSSSAV